MSVCVCEPGTGHPQYCPRHWPEYTVDSIGRAAEKARGFVDQLARDRETIATETLNTFGELLLPHVPYTARGLVQKLWTQFAPVAVERVVVKAKSIAVIDERGPGSTVDLVNDRSPVTVVELTDGQGRLPDRDG